MFGLSLHMACSVSAAASSSSLGYPGKPKDTVRLDPTPGLLSSFEGSCLASFKGFLRFYLVCFLGQSSFPGDFW